MTTGSASTGAPLLTARFYPFTAPAGPAAPDPDRGLEVKLATELRPRLRFDSGERWQPLEIEAFLRERFADGGGHVDHGSYLDIHGHGRDGTDYYSPGSGRCVTAANARSRANGFDCDRYAPTAIYYRRTTHDRLWFWDYWGFYRYNDYNGMINRCIVSCDDHEGDWEGLTIVTDAARQPRVLGAIIAEHKHLVATTVSALTIQDRHVVVYVANGTHATYRYACRNRCNQHRLGIADPTWPLEESHDGRWPWAGNSDMACRERTCVLPLEPIDWNGSRRLWGETCHKWCPPFLRGGSPQAPGQQPRYRCPWKADRVDRGESAVIGILNKLPSLAVGAPAIACPGSLGLLQP